MQVARTVNTLVLKAGNLDNFELGLVHADSNHRLYFKSVAVNFHVVKTVFPKGVVAIAQIAEACLKKQVDELTQSVVTHAAYECEIVATSTFRKPRAFGKIISSHDRFNKTRYLVGVGRSVSIEHYNDVACGSSNPGSYGIALAFTLLLDDSDGR